MRKYRYLAAAAAGFMVIGVSAGAALAAPAKSTPVLRISSTHGAAVKKGAKIGASLAKGQVVNLSIGTFKASCKTSSFGAKVVKNPAAKGKTTLSITSEKVGGCSISGVTFHSLTAINLPYNAVLTSKGALSITGTSKSRPLGFSAKISVDSINLTCVFTATRSSGKTSNKANTAAFKNQKFSLDAAASSSLCSSAGTTSTYSAIFGPIRDTSVKHHPKVFIG
jgi:hypothetical protein